VRFMQLNDVTRLLIGLMGEEPDADGRTLLLRVAEAIGHPRPEKVVQSGAAVLQDLLERGVILGTRISEPAP
jgi:hypothetical protein